MTQDVDFDHLVSERGLPLNAAAANAAFEQMLVRSAASFRHPATLSDHEAALIDEAGLAATTDPDQQAIVASRTAAAQAGLLATAIRPEQLAQSLEKTPSRIRQMIGTRQLVAIKTKGASWLPVFQFDQTNGRYALVPHADEVFAALPEGLAPVAMATWFTTPNTTLYLPNTDHPDTPLSPKAWLLSGLDPAPVIALAHEVAGESLGPQGTDEMITAALELLNALDRTVGTKKAHQAISQAKASLETIQAS